MAKCSATNIALLSLMKTHPTPTPTPDGEMVDQLYGYHESNMSLTEGQALCKSIQLGLVL